MAFFQPLFENIGLNGVSWNNSGLFKFRYATPLQRRNNHYLTTLIQDS